MHVIQLTSRLYDCHIDEFMQYNCDNIIELFVDDKLVLSENVNDIKNLFNRQEVLSLLKTFDNMKKTMISLASTNALLIFRAIDYLFYDTDEKISRLFHIKKKKEAKTKLIAEPSTIHVKLGIMKNNEVTDIEQFYGTKKDAVAWINKHYALAQIRTMFANNVMISVNSSDDNELINWKSVESLIDEGVFIK